MWKENPQLCSVMFSYEVSLKLIKNSTESFLWANNINICWLNENTYLVELLPYMQKYKIYFLLW